MDTRIRKDELLKILEENRTAHHGIYEEAKQNYLKAAEKALKEKVKEVNRGALVSLYIDMPIPEDHTRDYDRVIKMVNLDVRDELVLTDSEAQRFLMDEWPWRRAWVANTASYTAAAADYDA